MIQAIIVGLMFAGALVFLGRLIYNQLKAKSTCASNCGKCSVALDLNKIEKEIRTKNL